MTRCLLVSPTQNYVSVCTAGWSHLPSSGLCYAKPPVADTYPGSQAVCQGAYAMLAMPRKFEENAKVMEVRYAFCQWQNMYLSISILVW